MVMALIAIGAFGSVQAQTGGGKEKKPARLTTAKWNVSLGGLAATFKTETAFVRSGIGTNIRLESDLNLDRRDDSAALDFFYRLKKKSRVGFTYMDFSRFGGSDVSKDFDFGDLDIKGSLGAVVDTSLDTKLVKVDYRYSFVNDGRTEAGISGGVAYVDVNLRLSGEGFVSIDDGPVENGTFAEEVGVSLPVPVFGLFINHGITSKLIFRIGAESFELSVSGKRGRIFTSSFLFEYYFSKHVGIGGGVMGIDMSYDDTSKEDKEFIVEYRISGAALYLTLVF
jgi:hypothetical protein